MESLKVFKYYITFMQRVSEYWMVVVYRQSSETFDENSYNRGFQVRKVISENLISQPKLIFRQYASIGQQNWILHGNVLSLLYFISQIEYPEILRYQQISHRRYCISRGRNTMSKILENNSRYHFFPYHEK
jgi:hypothetical protein